MSVFVPVATMPDVRVSVPATVVFAASVTPPLVLAMVRLLKVVAPVIVCAAPPENVTLLPVLVIVAVPDRLLVQLPVTPMVVPRIFAPDDPLRVRFP